VKQAWNNGSEVESDSQERVRLAAEVFRKYSKEIRGMIQFTVEDQAEADDLFQDLFLSLVTRPLPPDIRSVKRYLYRAILHDVISQVRRERRHRRYIKVYASHQSRVWEEDPQDVLMRTEQMDEVLHMAQGLRPAEARAIMLEYAMGCDRRQASQDMGIKRRSFAKYLWRGLRRLRHETLIREGRDT